MSKERKAFAPFCILCREPIPIPVIGDPVGLQATRQNDNDSQSFSTLMQILSVGLRGDGPTLSIRMAERDRPALHSFVANVATEQVPIEEAAVVRRVDME